MAFTFTDDTLLTLEIGGKEYRAKIDRPEFVDFWRNNMGALDALSDKPNAARDVVKFTVDMTTALLGIEASREIFDGVELSLSECAMFIGYVMGEIEAHGLKDKLSQIASKYGTGSILR